MKKKLKKLSPAKRGRVGTARRSRASEPRRLGSLPVRRPRRTPKDHTTSLLPLTVIRTALLASPEHGRRSSKRSFLPPSALTERPPPSPHLHTPDLPSPRDRPPLLLVILLWLTSHLRTPRHSRDARGATPCFRRWGWAARPEEGRYGDDEARRTARGE